MSLKYKPRWIKSKGALLLLMWILLTCIACAPHINYLSEVSHSRYHLPKGVTVIPLVIGCLSTLLVGWLADTKFGNYRLFKAGLVMLFIYTVLNCLLLLVEALLWENSQNLLSTYLRFSLGSSLFMISLSILIVTALPLGLEQMSDASATSITSFIAWFVCSVFIGIWFISLLGVIEDKCIDKCKNKSTYCQAYVNYSLISSSISALCMSIVLISSFLFSPKWLTIEPMLPQSLRTIYHVLKFAAKHKAPLYSSALTYWQDSTPSRLDFGKSKHGGPFTTQQVEDVKTILRLLVISCSLSFIIYSLSLHSDVQNVSKGFRNMTRCSTNIIYLFTYDTMWCGIIIIIACELVIYPLIRNKQPSILKRIGAVSLMMTLATFFCFIIELAEFYLGENRATELTAHVLYHIAFGLFAQAAVKCVLEFLCAQSPNNMRGIFISIMVPVLCFSSAAGNITSNYGFDEIKMKSWSSLVVLSVKTLVCLVGFLLFCVVARWYKRRERGDDYSPQQVVVEVYNRHLTAAASQLPTVH